jgi:hypothetical protein
VRERGNHARLSTEGRDEPDDRNGRAYAAPGVAECEGRDEARQMVGCRHGVRHRENNTEGAEHKSAAPPQKLKRASLNPHRKEIERDRNRGSDPLPPLRPRGGGDESDEVLARRERVQERQRKSERPKKSGSSHQACG